MHMQGILAKAPQPGHIDINLTTINWWYYVLILTAIFLFLAFKGNQVYRSALGIMISTAVVYALVVTYVLPRA